MPTKYSIGFVLDDGLDVPDGVQQYVMTLGSWLSSQGHDVHYLVGETVRTDVEKMHVLSRNAKVRFNRNRMTIPVGASRKRIHSLLSGQQFDLLHVQMPYSPQLAGRIIAEASPKTVVFGTFHIVPYSSVQRHAARVLAVAIRGSLTRFDSIVSVSPAAADFASKTFGIESVTLPNVVNLSNYAGARPIRPPSGDRLRLLYLGRLVHRKGCLELLQAVARLPSSTDWQLGVCGDGLLRGSLEKFIKQHGLAHRVDFSGFIAEADKPGYLASADIAVFPSLGGESFGIVLLEAMAAGAGVVIGGDNPGYRTVLGRWPECMVSPREPALFAAQLERLIADKQLRRRLHTAQQQAVRRFDVETVGPELLAMYQSAIAKK